MIFKYLFIYIFHVLGQKKISVDENFLAEHFKFNSMKSEMEKAVVALKNNYIKNLSLRSSTGIY